MRFKVFYRSGLTVTELIVSVAIISLIAALTFSTFIEFRRAQVLNAGVEQTLTLLADARSRTLAAKAASRYGVHFASSTITLFKGTAYVPGATANTVITLTSPLEVSALSLAGGTATVVFDRLTGKTTQTGTVTLSIPGQATYTRVITISTTGIASAD